MPEFDEVVGIGAKYQYGEGGDSGADFDAVASADAWTDIGQLTDIKPPEDEVSDIKTTNFGTTDGVHTYIGGLIEPGSSEVKTQYSVDKYAELKAIRKLKKRFRIIFSDGTGLGWNGFGKSQSTEVDMDGMVIMTHKTKVSGDYVLIGSGS